MYFCSKLHDNPIRLFLISLAKMGHSRKDPYPFPQRKLTILPSPSLDIPYHTNLRHSLDNFPLPSPDSGNFLCGWVTDLIWNDPLIVFDPSYWNKKAVYTLVFKTQRNKQDKFCLPISKLCSLLNILDYLFTFYAGFGFLVEKKIVATFFQLSFKAFWNYWGLSR